MERYQLHKGVGQHKVRFRHIAVMEAECQPAAMILHNPDAEQPFQASIDARFPYEDASASVLIQQGWAISLNAAFCVLDELCRPPLTSGAVPKDLLRELVAEWAAGPDHPLKLPVLRAARALIEGKSLDWREGVALMKQVGTFDGQRAALGIAYFAAKCDSPEGDEALTAMETEIRVMWQAKGV